MGNEVAAAFVALGSLAAAAALAAVEPAPAATLLAAVIVVAADGVDLVAVVEIEGNPEAEVEEVLADRAFVDIATGGGTSGGELLAGSSYEGGGNTGFEEAFPVPDGPPPPVRRRGVEPAAPLAALNACSTICC